MSDPLRALAAFLDQEAEALMEDPSFALQVRVAARSLAVPEPAAVVSERTCAAVAHRCGDLIAGGNLRLAVALLAGHRLAVQRWTIRRMTYRPPRRHAAPDRVRPETR